MVERARRQRGATMLEVLVTLIIILFGLLGLIGMQAVSQQAQLEAYQRAQAVVLVQDMTDRINTNRKTAQCYEITTAAGSPFFGTGYSGTPTCTGYGNASSQALAVNEMTEWDGILKGSAETKGAASVGAIVGARGCVSYDAAASTIVVAIAWQGFTDTVAPVVPAGASTAQQNAIACGTGQYGAETKRRVVWRTIRIATLP
ncbi:MAG: type IV pilus modification protein PilV [Betaproteobacteria bacterium]